MRNEMNQGQEIRSPCLNQDSEMNGFWLRVGSFDGLGGTPLPKLRPPPPGLVPSCIKASITDHSL